GCGMEGFCMDSFHGTETVLRVLCLVHNLVQQFQDAIGLRPAHRPKEEGKRHTLETLRNRLFTCAAILGRSGRTLVLRLAASPPWWDAFQRALARLLPPQPNCRAAPEGPAHPSLGLE
ncbi:MAG: transposase, partial [Acidobacteriota bacterium]|nr:transposase [Acidobacteriota bacterium]